MRYYSWICVWMLAFATQAVGQQPDLDQDGIPDKRDNCLTVPNPGQEDYDHDKCGNHCDADYNQDGLVDAADFAIFEDCFDFLRPPKLICDHAPEELDGVVSILDFSIFRYQWFAGVPGPGKSPACDGKMR